MKKEIRTVRATLPVMALRGLVLFPGMMLHFDVGRKKSILALNEAMGNNQMIFLVAQRDIRDDDPTPEQLYRVGVVAQVRQILRQPEDGIRILVEGKYRAVMDTPFQQDPFLMAEVLPLRGRRSASLRAEALVREIQEVFDEYLSLAPKMAPDVILGVKSQHDPDQLCDYLTANLMLDYTEKQEILSELRPLKRLEMLLFALENETNLLRLQHEIGQRVKDQIDQNQREYYLREQIKVLTDELGEGDNPLEEAEEYKEKILALHLSEEIEEKLLKECARLAKMPAGAHEATVVRNYLDTCLELPWNKTTKDKIDLSRAQKILDNEHYGLAKVKERIVELLAVRKLAPDIKGQIICLVGPPGVGKTSIARSIAKAMGRKYVRIALGGVRDESDIRGHRKTYIGAMPGRIIAAVRQAGVRNPLMLLDEIDKLGSDFRGDPTSALLEVLDAEQNNTFHDHYIDLPFDLSDVLFLTTANDAGAIPAPLADRMDVITLSSYTEEEKFHIAKEHLIPKQLKKHGMTSRTFKMDDEALHRLIEGYTREAGVRTLERTIAALCRRAAKQLVSGEKKRVTVTAELLEPMLGPKKFKPESREADDQIGVATGLAWTSVGGETMPIEVAVLDGTGKVELTGSLGDVMKESARAAITCIRSRAKEWGLSSDFYSKKDIHIHVPEGAIPKDGPSAGITMATAILSALTGIPVRRDVAMTGEITLRGRVLPIGGLKEKTMAAYRLGMQTVIIPKDNEPDLAEIEPVVREHLRFVAADTLDLVLENALLRLPGAEAAQPPEPQAVHTELHEQPQRPPAYIAQ